MLNRKISNYLFYGSLVLIVAIVVLVRVFALGSVKDKIEILEESNIYLQTQNNTLEEQVEEYKDIQTDHLYELYGKTPNYFSQADLTYYTISQLELLGISEELDYQRTVTINSEISFDGDSVFSTVSTDFKVVEIQVLFNTLDVINVEDFIDSLYNSEQVFIVNKVEYTTPVGNAYITASISFLAFYELQDDGEYVEEEFFEEEAS